MAKKRNPKKVAKRSAKTKRRKPSMPSKKTASRQKRKAASVVKKTSKLKVKKRVSKLTKVLKVTPKQTSGAGFVFEDKVAANFLSRLLNGSEPFPGILGKVHELRFQTRRNGWVVDDFLLSLVEGGNLFRVAVSSKSNDQITLTGIERSSLTELWETYLNVHSDAFDKEKDYLCLVVAPLRTEVSKMFHQLLKEAREQSDDDFYYKIENETFSAAELTLLRGLLCPTDLADQHKLHPKDLRKFLGRIILLEVDFERQQSQTESTIIDRCREILVSGATSEARDLFQKLCAIRDQQAPFSGFINYEKLVVGLREFKIRGLADFETDWRSIRLKTQQKLSIIPDQIGGKLKLERSAQIEEIEKWLSSQQILFMLGQSGFGKTILAKNIAIRKQSQNLKVIWLDAEAVEGDIEGHFKLHHHFSDIIKIPDQEGLIIVDGIDRFNRSNTIQHLAIILQSALYQDSPWKIIFTCQSEDFNTTVGKLQANNVLVPVSNSIEISVSDNEQDAIVRTFPELYDLFKNEHLKPVFNNLKYLDLLATGITRGVSFDLDSATLGETDIIDKLWEQAMSGDDDKADERANFLKMLAQKQASSASLGIPTAEFSPSDSGSITNLKRSKLIREAEDKLYFVHDLFGDWARFKILRSQSGQIKQFVLKQDLSSPLWGRAIRLYGSYLLEKRGKNNEWLSFFNEFNPVNPNEKIIQDLLLESILYSSRTKEHLNTNYSALVANKAELLIRFLQLFLFRATIQNETAIKASKKISGITVAIASVIERELRHLYWPDLIEFLFEHKNEKISELGAELRYRQLTVTIAESWLTKTHQTTPWRRECAQLALENYSWLRSQPYFIPDEIVKSFYEAVLASAREYPSEVTDIALRLAKRKREPSDEFKIVTTRDGQQLKIPNSRPLYPEGPFEEIESVFRNLILNEIGLLPLSLVNREAVKEIILALLGPAPRRTFYDSERQAFLGFVENFGEHDALYSGGPFLAYLKSNIEHGIDIVLAVVKYATDNFVAPYLKKGQTPPSITLQLPEGDKQFIGNDWLYFWFRDQRSTPYLLASALMALEKMLLDLLESGREIGTHISRILKESNSVAVLGLLVSIGKRNPSLFLKELKPLLSVLDFYIWDHMNQTSDLFRMASTTDASKTKLLREWHGLPHRQIQLRMIAINLMFAAPREFRKRFSEVVGKWKEQMAKTAEHMYTYLSNDIIESFDEKNYKLEEVNGKERLFYIQPEYLEVEGDKHRSELTSDTEITFFGNKCITDLQQNKVFTEAELQIVWDKITKFSTFTDGNVYDQLNPKLSAVFGGMSVLIEFYDLWLKQHEEETEWIVAFIEKTIDGWKLDDIESHPVLLPGNWNNACATLLPRLLSMDYNNKRLRRITGSFLLKAGYQLVNVFVNSLSKHNSWHDAQFIAVQNLVIRRSQILQLDTDDASSTNQFDLILEDFVNLRYPSKLIDWTQDGYLDEETQEIPLQGNQVNSKLLTALYWNFTTEAENLNSERQRYALNVDSLLFKQLLYDMSHSNETDVVNQFQKRLISRFVSIILNLSNSTDRAGYWQPIVNFGYGALTQVQFFLTHFFLMGASRGEPYSIFLDTWKEILKYVPSADSWKTEDFKKQISELWPSLFGLSYEQVEKWRTGKFDSFLEAVAPVWASILTSRFFSRRLIERLVYFLSSKAAKSHLRYAIPVINKHIQLDYNPELKKAAGTLIYQTYEKNEELAQTLSFIWDNFRSEITSDEGVFSAYKQLVIHLASKLNSIGLALKDQIVAD